LRRQDINYLEKNNLFIKISIALVILFGYLAYQQMIYRVLSPNVQVSKFMYVLTLIYPTILFWVIIGILSLKKIQNWVQESQIGQIFIISGIIVLILLWSSYVLKTQPFTNTQDETKIYSWVLTSHICGWSLLLIGLQIFKKSRIFIENNNTIGKITVVFVILFFFLNFLEKHLPLSSFQESYGIAIMKLVIIVYTSTLFLGMVGLLNRHSSEWLLSAIALISLGIFVWKTALGIRFIVTVSLDGFFLPPLLFATSASVFLFLWKRAALVVVHCIQDG